MDDRLWIDKCNGFIFPPIGTNDWKEANVIKSHCVVQKLVPTKLCKAGTPDKSGKEVHFQDLSNVRKLEIVHLMDEGACFKDNSEKDMRSTCF